MNDNQILVIYSRGVYNLMGVFMWCQVKMSEVNMSVVKMSEVIMSER